MRWKIQISGFLHQNCATEDQFPWQFRRFSLHGGVGKQDRRAIVEGTLTTTQWCRGGTWSALSFGDDLAVVWYISRRKVSNSYATNTYLFVFTLIYNGWLLFPSNLQFVIKFPVGREGVDGSTTNYTNQLAIYKFPIGREGMDSYTNYYFNKQITSTVANE